MKDGIIAGTGNSRYLKTVENFLTLYPTYNDFAAAFIAGTLPIDLNGINASGWTQLASALSKANLLPDAVAEALGLVPANDPQVKDALNAIANNCIDLRKYWWKKYSLAYGESLGTEQTVSLGTTSSISGATSIAINADTGVITLGTTSSYSVGSATIIGKYFSQSSKIYKVTGSGTATNIMGTYIYSVPAKEVTSALNACGTFNENVNSFIATDYPNNGVQSGYYYKASGQVVNPVSPQIVSGTYKGTGTYGSANPNTLPFSGEIIMLWVMFVDNTPTIPSAQYARNGRSFILGDMLTEDYVSGNGLYNTDSSNAATSYGKKSSDGKSYSWYNATSAAIQLNTADATYRYLALLK